MVGSALYDALHAIKKGLKDVLSPQGMLEDLGLKYVGPVDGHDVPVPHFVVVLTQADWEALAERVRSAGVKFVIEPYTRFKGEVGEQSTMFFLDPSGNALEFKAFADLSQLFAK